MLLAVLGDYLFNSREVSPVETLFDQTEKLSLVSIAFVVLVHATRYEKPGTKTPAEPCSAVRTLLISRETDKTRGKLDRVDFRILKSLLASNGTPPGAALFRKSFRSMARDLGIDQGTVRSRIRAFQERGILRGWYLGVSPSATGQDVIYSWLLVGRESRKEDLIQKFLSQKEVERVCNYLGPKLSLVLLCEKSLDPSLALGRLAVGTGISEVPHVQAAIHSPPGDLKETDIAIIDELRRDPWRPYSEIARELRTSDRTVKRRAKKLAEAGTIYMLPVIDVKAIQGIIPMELVVQYDSEDSKSAVNRLVLSRVKESLVFSNISGLHGYFALAVPNLAYVEQIAGWVEEQKGVKQAYSNALQDVILNRRHYERPPRLAGSGYERERIVA